MDPERGDGEALAALLATPADAPHYRQACLRAVDLACRLGTASASLDQFLAPFLASGPRGHAEAEACYRLGLHYAEGGHADAAREVLGCLERAWPRYRDAAAVLARLGPPSGRASAPDLLRSELSFRGSRVRGLVEQRLLEEGALLAGRYRVERAWNEPWFGFAARDTASGDEVAARLLPRELLDADDRARFGDQMAGLARLDHPNVLKLLDHGFLRHRPFVVTARVRGGSLRRRLAWPVPLRDAVELMRQACAGLGAAHERGIVHGALGAEWLLLTPEGDLQVAGCGVAQALGERGGVASDLGGLGRIAKDLLAGRAEAAPWLRDLLAEDPATRPASCRELAEQLARFAARVA